MYKMRNVFPSNDMEFIDYLKSKTKLTGAFFNFIGDNNIPSENRYLNISKENLNNYFVDNLITFDFSKTKIYDYENPYAMTVFLKNKTT